jgi:hypothetical protein
MTDRLTLAHALEGANIEREAAERIATEIYDAITANVATKQDLQQTEVALKADIAAVRADMDQRFTGLDLRFERLERRIDGVEHRLITRLGGLVIAVATLLFAALHAWPPK